MNFQKWTALLLHLPVLVLFLPSCADSGSGRGGKTIKVVKTSGYNQNHGPFDSNGNYREEWADNPPRRIYVTKEELEKDGAAGPPVAYQPPVAPPTTYNPPVSQPTYTPPPYTQPKPKPKPKPTVTKPKRKPPIIHTVKKGDTLYGLAKRYRSGVKTIQIANGLRGTTIRIGQKLKIPRY